MIHVRACMMLNEPEAARTAVKLHNEQFKSFKLSNVSTVSNILSFNSIEDEWFMAALAYAVYCHSFFVACGANLKRSIVRFFVVDYFSVFL